MSNGQQAVGWVIYPVGSKPRWGLAFFLGFQHFLTMFGATISIPLIVGGAMGFPTDQLAVLIAAVFLNSGITTWCQQLIGNKLPIVQGGSFSFLGPTFAIIGMVQAQGGNWQMCIQHVSGAILFASVFEIILGYSGLMGKVKKLIGPLSIGPTITMIGLALYGVGAPYMASNWTISFITLIALILYSQVFSRKSRVFLLFPVILAVATGWIASVIGTLAGWIPAGNAANLTEAFKNIAAAPWITFKPYIPFRWGFPTNTGILVAGSFGMLAAYLSSMVESIGDYHSCAKISEAPPPTERMISRGLGAEGVGCAIAGILQSGNGSTSYSENIGAIGLTRVAARRVVRAGAIIMIIIPFIGKLFAVFATLPQPVVGAMYVGLFGLIAAVGLNNLQYVNLNNARNLFILGLALFGGLSFPQAVGPIRDKFSSQLASGATFGTVLGLIVFTIFSTPMAVAAITGIVLDNLLPGATRDERGFTYWEREATEEAWQKAEAEWAKMKEGEERKLSGFEASQ
ncbi:uracil-xanthine permease family protein [Thermodesulfovibrio yellowstonii]|uniref:uracil-xanthine permease family protein n=1 Tax=Thermodesulfovibrio yellowstonii TaxID=28262 RepID=UPI003C7AFE62